MCSISSMIHIHRTSMTKRRHTVLVHLSGQSVCTLSLEAFTKLYQEHSVWYLAHK